MNHEVLISIASDQWYWGGKKLGRYKKKEV